EWIWKHVQALFPSACQVLDYYHCAEYLHKVAKAQYGQTVQALEWVEATLTRLYMGKLGTVLGGLRRMQPTSEEGPTGGSAARLATVLTGGSPVGAIPHWAP